MEDFNNLARRRPNRQKPDGKIDAYRRDVTFASNVTYVGAGLLRACSAHPAPALERPAEIAERAVIYVIYGKDVTYGTRQHSRYSAASAAWWCASVSTRIVSSRRLRASAASPPLVA
jgi:hypothetical protein